MAVRPVPRGMIGRAMTSAALAIVLLASGLQAAAPPSPPADGSTAVTLTPTAAPGSSATVDGPMVSAMTPVSADPEYADQIVALGLDEATAAFMARTLSTVDVMDAHTFVVHHAFPNGATGDETYHLVQGSEMNPGDPPTIVHGIVGDALRYQLRYALDPAELPEDLRAQVLEGLPVLAESAANATTPAVRLLGLAPVGPVRGGLRGRRAEHGRGGRRRRHLSGQEHCHRQVREVRREAGLHQDGEFLQGLQGRQEGVGGSGSQ